jgi:methionine aminotransferase
MVQINSKLPAVGTTIFTVMSSLAVKHNAINLGQGFPDFPMDEKLQYLVTAAMREGHNQYVHMNGLPALRERLAAKFHSLYGAGIDPEASITITPGATYAIYTALTAIIEPGDEVILFEPAYDSYVPNIEINGGVAVPIQLEFPEYKINWDKVKEKLTKKTRAIIINTPHNPTGAVLSEDDILMLRKLVEGTDIFIISDEVYEHLIFDGKQHLSLLRYPDLFARSFISFSFGKVFHCTGWKMGYSVAPPEWMKEFRKVHQFNCFTCNSPVQYAISAYLNDPDTYLSLSSLLQSKRDYFAEKMKATRFRPLPSFGSYFQLYSYADISDESELDFAKRLTSDHGVATIPVSAFYKTPVDNKVIRFCFAKKESTLDAAVVRLSTVYST